MPGIVEMQNVTMQNITNIINLSSGDPTEFYIRANHYIYGGWFIFIMIWLLAFLIWRVLQEVNDQPLINAMHVMTGCTVVSFFLRAISIAIDGVPMGLLTDFQMWIFPLLAVFLATIVRYMSN